MHAMEISRTGLEVEWRRLEVIAENIANVNTTRTGDGGPYRAMRLLSGPRANFAGHLQAGIESGRLSGVSVQGVEAVGTSPRRVYEPAHPHANADGFVDYPSVNHAEEMVLMVKTARAYEANIVAMNIARQMYVKAMELGRRS